MTDCEPIQATGSQGMTSVCEAVLLSRGGIPRHYRILDFGCGLGDGMSGSSVPLTTRLSV